jgi:iron complex transport system substrate-binding protein
MKLFILLACLFVAKAHAAISVQDDYGNTISLQKPAQRVISLSPGITELLFAAGGGERIVGVMNYSDYPEAAKRIPQIGNDQQIDIERVIAMKPELIVAWLYSGSERQLAQFKKLGIPVFHSEPRKLDDIPSSILRLGQLLGADTIAQASAAVLRKKLAALSTQYQHRSPVRLFYQIAERPLYTLNGQHIVSDAIHLCGGVNVFAKLDVIAPLVSMESVIMENPDAIIVGGKDGDFKQWRAYPSLKAVRGKNLITVDGNILNRPGPRMIDGVADLCDKLERVRQHRVMDSARK